jgi:acid phosphatase type 7
LEQGKDGSRNAIWLIYDPPLRALRLHLSRLAALAGVLGLGILAAGSLSAPAAALTVAFAPTDDTYADSTAPDLARGEAVEGRVDSYPLRQAYLRFEVSGLSAPVSLATLRIYSRTAHWLGFEVRSVASTSWDEGTLVFENAPEVSASVTSSSGSVGLGSWVDLDVTPLVAGNGVVAFALTTNSVTNLPLAMKESGEALAPQLIIEAQAPSTSETTTTPSDTTTPPEAAPTETTPTETTPTETAPTETAPTETTPTETTPTETAPTETTPTETTPTETTPTETTPTETTPTETTPTETTPTETTPTETTPTETTPTETTPTETTPAPDTSPPSSPVGLAVTGVTATSASVSWEASSDDVGVTGYSVYSDGTLIGSSPEANFTLSGLMCDSSHDVAVDAYDAAGNRSAASAALTVATSACPDVLPPTAPANVHAVDATASTVSVVWDVSTDEVGVTGYRLYRDGAYIAATQLPEYTFGSLDCGSGHELGVDAFDAAGNVSARATLTAATAACTSDAVIAIAGDIAGDGTGDSATAALLDSLQPTAVLTAGDNAYSDGSLSQYTKYYDPTWGRHKELTFPTPGNHEYQTEDADGYFRYFGSRAGDPGKGWYSYDLGSWHLISLNSELAHDAGSEQVTWLRSDLAASGARCVLAYWHQPRFAAGTYGDMSEFQPFWSVLYTAGAELVVNGHDHNYQRFAPMTPAGARDNARGIREFIVGTGGRSHYGLRADSRREAGDSTTYGVLRLTLREGGYEWMFVPEDGKTYRDSGSESCH